MKVHEFQIFSTELIFIFLQNVKLYLSIQVYEDMW